MVTGLIPCNLLKTKTTLLVLIASIVLVCPNVFAVESSGNLRIGGVSGKSDFPGDLQGETNDVQAISTRLQLDVDGLTRKDDYLQFDLRDRYDFFGRAESEVLALTAENILQIREAAYRRPWERNRHHFTVGRFRLDEAGILANDGASYGYRLSRYGRIGFFLGIAPEDIVKPPSVEPDVRGFDGNQGGVYYSYDKKNSDGKGSIYMNHAISQAPSFELNEFINRVFYFHQGVFLLGSSHRFSSFVNFDLAPAASLRRGYLSYGYYSGRSRLRMSLTRITAEDYRVQQNVLDDLEPSTRSSLSTDYQYRLTSSLDVRGGIIYDRRSVDGLGANDIYAGARYNGLLSKQLALGVRYGIRDDFLSDDSYLRLTANYFHRNFSINLQYSSESRVFDDGSTLNPTIIYSELGFYLSDKIRGSLAYSTTSAEDRNITTAFFMMAYRFGSDSVAPVRRRTPSFEEF